MVRNFVLLMLLASISGCSSKKVGVRDFIKCGFVASALDQQQASDTISRKLARYLVDNHISWSEDAAMNMVNEIRNDDLELPKKTQRDQIITIIETFNSEKCRSIHEMPEFRMM